MESLDRDILFVALTRPQMLLGVPFGYAVANVVITTELFLLFQSFLVIIVSLIVHTVGGCSVCATLTSSTCGW